MKLLFAGVALALLAALPVAAQNRDFAPDITGPSARGPSLVVDDHDLAHDDAAGGVTGFLIPPGTLPANVEIAGYHPLASGNTLLSLDTTTALPGLPAGSPAEPRDVVEYAPGTGDCSRYFLDGVGGRHPSERADRRGERSRPGSTRDVLVRDVGDVARVGRGRRRGRRRLLRRHFAIAYDGSAAGVASALDLDACCTRWSLPPGCSSRSTRAAVVGGVSSTTRTCSGTTAGSAPTRCTSMRRSRTRSIGRAPI